MERKQRELSQGGGEITLFMCGDIMTGRGIDQVLPHPCDPRIYEDDVKSSLRYVALAEERSGLIPRPVGFAYVWGDALVEFEHVRPDVRIVNLETSITRYGIPEPKGINYRMSPENVPCLTAAGIDCVVLANNHILDWGAAGLDDTLRALAENGLRSAGAGPTLKEAAAPAIIEVAGKGRVVVFAFGSATSGIARTWAATAARPGINLLADLSDRTVDDIANQVHGVKQTRDIVVVSIHWGGNWGYDVTSEERQFAHRLIEKAAVDVIHGHSSHHVKGIEVYRDKPILYGCGDFLNDYEGIGKYAPFRDDLVLMYFAAFEVSKRKLIAFEMTPLQIKKFRLNRPSTNDVRFLLDTLRREGAKFGTSAAAGECNRLRLNWGQEESALPAKWVTPPAAT